MYVVCLLFYAIGWFNLFLYLSFSFPEVHRSTARRGTIILLFQYMLTFYVLQHGHLLDCYLIKFLETFALRKTFVDKDRIEVLHVTQANQLVNCRVIANIAFVASIQRLGDRVKAFNPASRKRGSNSTPLNFTLSVAAKHYNSVWGSRLLRSISLK